MSTKLSDEGGRLEFEIGTCDLGAAASAIELTATAADQTQLEALKDVVARRLVRVSSNDQLIVTWTPTA